MAHSRELAARFEAYTDWRRRLSSGVAALGEWLDEQDLSNSQTEQRIGQIVSRLRDDQLVVAFVAEFSRGKSELINAIFFADYGQRLLPSSAGRTTMCPTELLYDASEAPSVKLLPIETRLESTTVAELKLERERWTTIPLDLSSADRMSDALARVSEVKRVPEELARELGLHDEADAGVGQAKDGGADIPAWRHAVVNFPHPLLQQGLVILDTPGLNAIGAEPELTLALLPNAHAVLFIVAADAGVTRSDLEVWNQHLAGADPTQKAGRIVVLNKIDGLWDDLRPRSEVEAEIARQMRSVAGVLGIDTRQVFGVSAQKALSARVHGDDTLLARSRIPALEAALSQQLLPSKREIVGAAVQADVHALASAVRATLDARQATLAEQIAELRGLRGKNQEVIGHMLDRVRLEKESFEKSLQKFGALRNVLAEQSNELFRHIGMEALRATALKTRQDIESSPFTRGVRVAMAQFFTTIRREFEFAADKSSELHDLMQAMYGQFAKEHGLERFSPPAFSMERYCKEFDRLERAYEIHFNTFWNMVSKAKFSLMKRFFETIASRVLYVYKVANRDLETWLRAVVTPLESQVKEQQAALQRRLDGIRRIHRASGELEDRVAEIEEMQEAIIAQLDSLDREIEAIDAILLAEEQLPLAANF